TAARIEVNILPRRFNKRSIFAIPLSNAFAQRAISFRASEFLNPRMLIRRHRLRGKLPSDPGGFLGEDDIDPQRSRRKRSGGPTGSGANDQNLRRLFTTGHIGVLLRRTYLCDSLACESSTSSRVSSSGEPRRTHS